MIMQPASDQHTQIHQPSNHFCCSGSARNRLAAAVNTMPAQQLQPCRHSTAHSDISRAREGYGSSGFQNHRTNIKCKLPTLSAAAQTIAATAAPCNTCADFATHLPLLQPILIPPGSPARRWPVATTGSSAQVYQCASLCLLLFLAGAMPTAPKLAPAQSE